MELVSKPSWLYRFKLESFFTKRTNWIIFFRNIKSTIPTHKMLVQTDNHLFSLLIIVKKKTNCTRLKLFEHN
jgi:hypothetical protein